MTINLKNMLKTSLNFNLNIICSFAPVLNLTKKHTHLKDTISLSIPLIMTQIGHIITGMVDNIFDFISLILSLLKDTDIFILLRLVY